MCSLTALLFMSILSAQSPEHEWAYMDSTQRRIVLQTRAYGQQRGYSELGAHVAVETRGDTAAINREDLYNVSACELQVNVHYPTVRVFGPDYSQTQFNHIRDLLIMSRRH